MNFIRFNNFYSGNQANQKYFKEKQKHDHLNGELKDELQKFHF